MEVPEQSKGKGKDDLYVLPVNDQIKVIDFGGATFAGEYKTKVINTRQYRAPEVLTRNNISNTSERQPNRMWRVERKVRHLVSCLYPR